ncbi:MAG TPA: hypothetical protein VHB21_20690 [Minicystis sp.]|nr:hypothetical protein [Minicystis sp.]
MRTKSSDLRWMSTLAVALAALAVGCEKSPRDRLQGRWLGESIDNVPADEVQKATGWVKGTAMEFSGNKVTVTIPAETPRTGSFKVTKAEGDRLVVSFFREEGGRDDAEVQLVGDQALRWHIGQGREIVLIRAKN